MTIIDGSNPQEPADRHFPGDDLLAPLERRRGLPIGNLTSQFFANLYLDPLDHFATEVLRLPYLRYVDDFALFADDAAVLEAARARIATFLAGRRLVLHPRKTVILPCDRPAAFCGVVLAPGGGRRLPEENVARFHNRLRGMADRLRAGTIAPELVEARVAAWRAHARTAGGARLATAILARSPAVSAVGRVRESRGARPEGLPPSRDTSKRERGQGPGGESVLAKRKPIT